MRHERVNDKRSGIRGTEGWRGAAYVTPRRVPVIFRLRSPSRSAASRLLPAARNETEGIGRERDGVGG